MVTPLGSAVASTAVWLPFCLIMVGRRIFVARSHSGLKTEDWLAVAALILMISVSVCMLLGESQRTALTVMDASTSASQSSGPNSMMPAHDDFLAFIALHTACLCCCKMSSSFTYRRIFCTRSGDRTMRILCNALIGCMGLWGLTFLVAIVLTCPLLRREGLGEMGDGVLHGSSTRKMALALSVTDFITYDMLLSVSIWMVVPLQMRMKLKLRVCGGLFLGLLPLLASLARIIVWVRCPQVDELGGASGTAVSPTDYAPTAWLLLCYNQLGLALISICLHYLKLDHLYRNHKVKMITDFGDRPDKNRAIRIDVKRELEMSVITRDELPSEYGPYSLSTICSASGHASRLARGLS